MKSIIIRDLKYSCRTTMNDTETLHKLCLTKDVEAIKGLFCSDCKIVHNNLPFPVLILLIMLVGLVGYLLAKNNRIQNV